MAGGGGRKSSPDVDSEVDLDDVDVVDEVRERGGEEGRGMTRTRARGLRARRRRRGRGAQGDGRRIDDGSGGDVARAIGAWVLVGFGRGRVRWDGGGGAAGRDG